HVDLDLDAELRQHVRGRVHDAPVGVRPHDDADQRSRGRRRPVHPCLLVVVPCPPVAGAPSSSPRRSAAARFARARTSGRSLPLTVTCPSLRPGRTSLPYRLTWTAGSARTCGSASVSVVSRDPRTLTMTVHGATGAGEPSGRSSTARRCWANWLVTAPVMVQCPEL